MTRRPNSKVDAQRSIGSVETAMKILSALGDSLGSQSLKSISETCGMPPSNLHRYLASFVRTGFVRQDPETRNYELAGAALQLGLSALNQLDIVRLASQATISLSEETGLSSLTAVWSERGPTVIRIQRGRNHVITSIGLGSVLPPLTSATGQVLLAFSSTAMTSRLLAAQRRMLERSPNASGATIALEKLLSRTKQRRLAWVDGAYIPGLRAVSAPVLDAQGEAALAITLMSASEPIAHPNHTAAKALLKVCNALSSQAGPNGAAP